MVTQILIHARGLLPVHCQREERWLAHLPLDSDCMGYGRTLRQAAAQRRGDEHEREEHRQ
jgi:hypothetical protein